MGFSRGESAWNRGRVRQGAILEGMAGWRRPLVVGASGQVGAAIAVALERRGESVPVRSSRVGRPGWLRLDAAELVDSSRELAAVGEIDPDLIVCAGGTTFVDGCEREPEACFRANATGPAALAAFAYERRVPFVFFSSDYVFGGRAAVPGPYGEKAETDPLSVYGRSKLAGERAVLAEHPGALIVRTTVVYGPDTAGKNFLYTLLRHLATGQRLRVPMDQVSTPTYNRDLAEAVLELVDCGASGVMHVAGPELMDRLEFAREVAGFFGLDASCVEGVTTASLGQAAARPLHSGLSTGRLEQLLPLLRRHTLREALADTEVAMHSFLASVSQQHQEIVR